MKQTKIIAVEIQENGKAVRLETNRDDAYKFVWVQAEDLEAICAYTKHL